MKKFIVLNILIASFSLAIFADDQVVTEAPSRKYTVGGNFSFLDTWVPGKFGVNLTYTPSSSASWELAYLKGSISRAFYFVDIGSITDERFSLVYRSFKNRKSLNFFWGGFYEVFKASLGSDFLATVSGAPVQSVDLVEIATLGVSWGFGNRWRFANNATFGVDWFTINVPLTTVTSETDFLTYSSDGEKREDVRDIVDALEKIPTMSVLKLQIGYSF